MQLDAFWSYISSSQIVAQVLKPVLLALLLSTLISARVILLVASEQLCKGTQRLNSFPRTLKVACSILCLVFLVNTGTDSLCYSLLN